MCWKGRLCHYVADKKQDISYNSSGRSAMILNIKGNNSKDNEEVAHLKTQRFWIFMDFLTPP